MPENQAKPNHIYIYIYKDDLTLNNLNGLYDVKWYQIFKYTQNI